jgi:hypothetical protein
MRLPIGSSDVSASGGTVTLIGRRGEGWERISGADIALDTAVSLLTPDAATDRLPAGTRSSWDIEAPRFDPGQDILWRYGRQIETARVVQDNHRGLVAWIPTGSERLEAAPADGRRTRDLPLSERFSVPWVMRQATWRGPGLLRIAPTGRPWSVGFFRREDGTPDGAYVNLELPHRRLDGTAAVFTRDVILDLWIDAEHPGAEDVWLKDADELEAAVAQGRYTAEQAEAVRSIADHALTELIAPGGWPLDEPWDCWMPDAAMDDPVRLPATAEVDAARRWSGRTSRED